MTGIDERLARLVAAHALRPADGAPAGDFRLREDLGCDPLALAELACAIEDEFGIDVDAAELSACATLAQLRRLISAKAG